MCKKAKMIFAAFFQIIIGICIGMTIVRKGMARQLADACQLSQKHLKMFLLMNMWVKKGQQGKKVVSFFRKEGYKRIAIYGMSYVGKTLFEELKNTDVKALYGIDQKASEMCSEINMVTIEDTLEEVDAIVVTAIGNFYEIEEKLKQKISCPIISIEDILYML